MIDASLLHIEVHTSRKLYSGRKDEPTYRDQKQKLKKTPSINTIGTDEFINDLAQLVDMSIKDKMEENEDKFEINSDWGDDNRNISGRET